MASDDSGGADKTPKHEESPSAPTTQLEVTKATVETVAFSGRRQAFKDIRRQLTEADLSTPGVQKMLLEDLQLAEDKCDILEGYVERFHEADKRAAVLEEKLITQNALEILFAVGLGVGCGIIGVTPLFWDATSKGPIALAIGVLLVGGATGARLLKR